MYGEWNFWARNRPFIYLDNSWKTHEIEWRRKVYMSLCTSCVLRRIIWDTVCSSEMTVCLSTHSQIRNKLCMARTYGQTHLSSTMANFRPANPLDSIGICENLLFFCGLVADSLTNMTSWHQSLRTQLWNARLTLLTWRCWSFSIPCLWGCNGRFRPEK